MGRNKLKSLKVAQSKDDDGGVMNACMNGCVNDGMCYVECVMCMMVCVMLCIVCGGVGVGVFDAGCNVVFDVFGG